MGKKGGANTPREEEFSAAEQQARDRLVVEDYGTKDKINLEVEKLRLGKKAAGAVHYSVEVDELGNLGTATYNQSNDGLHSECVICADKITDLGKKKATGVWTIINSLPPCNGCYKYMLNILVNNPDLQITVRCDTAKGDKSTHKYSLGG